MNHKQRKWGFALAGAVATITPYMPVIKPVVRAVSDGLDTNRHWSQIVTSALIAGLVAYQAFKADPKKDQKPAGDATSEDGSQ